MDNEALYTLETLKALEASIPEPVRRNFAQAFGQLCSAAVSIPTAYLEGKAAEKKAFSDARVQIIKANADAISTQLNVPKEYIDKASEKFASKIVREQINLDKIVLNAANDLIANPLNESVGIEEKKESKIIDEDWLNEFENHARLKSSEDMSLLFGKILSGEIRKPGSFSTMAIRLMSDLDDEVAKLFQSLCSITFHVVARNRIFDARAVSLNGNAYSNSLSKFGLSFDNLNVLNEYGLIVAGYHSNFTYLRPLVAEGRLPFYYAGKCFDLTSKDMKEFDRFVLTGVALTRVAKELLPIIPIQENETYTKQLYDHFDERGFTMVEVKE